MNQTTHIPKPTREHCLRHIVSDERGSLFTMELILVATVLGLGAVVGLSTFRDSITQELGDVSAGLASIDHGYEYNLLAVSNQIDNMRFDFNISGSQYIDESNFCEPAELDPIGDSPMCMSIVDSLIFDEGQVIP